MRGDITHQCSGLIFAVLSLSVHTAVGKPAPPPLTNEAYKAIKGESIELYCLFQGDGETGSWTYQQLNQEGRYATYSLEGFPNVLYLFISDVQYQDAGDFTCVGESNNSTTRLQVIEATPPHAVRLQSDKPTEVTVSWAAPLTNPEEVIAYAIYVTRLEEPRMTAKYDYNNVSRSGKESFVVGDLIPGTSYEFKLACIYHTGPEEDEFEHVGPLSDGAQITLEKEDSPDLTREDVEPEEVRAQQLQVTQAEDASLDVSWHLPLTPTPESLLGFKVTYWIIAPKMKVSPKQGLRVSAPDNQNSNGSFWQAALKDLETGAKYSISVRPILKSGFGPPTTPVSIWNKAVYPQLGIRAAVLGPDTVMVTYSVLGRVKPSNVKLSFSNESAIKWKYFRINYKDKFAIVADLQPRSTYFFKVMAKLGKSHKEAVTYVTTPPSDLSTPTNLTVRFQDDDRVQVVWSHDNPADVKGYKVSVEEKQPDQSYKILNQTMTSSNQMEAVFTGLNKSLEYRVKVTPFGLQGPGEPSEATLFPLEAEATKQQPVLSDEPREPLTFTSYLPDLHPVEVGGDITLNCSVIGQPQPQVRWYKDDHLVATAALDELSVLFEETGITGNFSLRCVASNDLQLISQDVQVFQQDPEEISVEVYIVHVSETEVLVKWVVITGDLDSISGFLLSLHDVMDSELSSHFRQSDARSLQLDQLTGHSKYKLVLRTLTTTEQADRDELDFVVEPPDTVTENMTKLHLDILEVRDDQARLDIRITGPKAKRLAKYRVTVNYVTPLGHQHVIEIHTVRPENPSLVIEGLEPHRLYEVVVQALPKAFPIPVVSEKVRFYTSIPGRSAQPVLSPLTLREMTSSKETISPSDITMSSTPMTTQVTTQVTTPLSIAVSTAVSTAVTTPVSVDQTELTTDPDTETTVAPAENSTTATPDDGPYIMTLRELTRTSSTLRIGWFITQGNLGKIDTFLFQIRSESGKKLSEKKLKSNERLQKLSLLQPNTTYLVTLQAKDAQAKVLAQAEMPVRTKATDTLTDMSDPVLFLEANEIRSDQVLLMWDVQDVNTSVISSFRLKVQVAGPGGTTLLDRDVASKFFTIRLGLQPNKRFYVTLDVIGDDNQPFLRSALTMETPEANAVGTPVNGSAMSIPPAATTTTASVTLGRFSNPDMTLVIVKMSPNNLILSWNLKDVTPGYVKEFKLTIREDSMSGPVWKSELIPTFEFFKEVNGLSGLRTYYLKFEALSPDGTSFLEVNTSFIPAKLDKTTTVLT
ncbi:hypothetical protein PoB_000359700 [Plakobranchus ocellatus]|uniref:Uncharacterized protein n=1 Tax=Plakobranchus ocellatus TaxID=259542 RepID=A0AAV3Y4R9_9GAST|nr:hypothetical protein PoB_000359700 [Plakobranchus ocellatus]